MPRRMTKTERQVLVDDLHDVGLRATPARVAVLDAVRGASAPLTHADLSKRLDGNGWDAATIYRNLVAISDAGLVTRTDHGDRLWRFESKARVDEAVHQHPHFLCTDCGEVSCLPDVEVSLPQAPSVPRSAVAGAFEVQLRGVCDACAD